MKLSNTTQYLLAFSALLLFGCEVESEKSDYICFNAENRFIDEETGTRPVNIIEFGGITDIGYMARGSLVNHSECAPAKTTYTQDSTLYQWFEYGNPTPEDGVISIEFYIKNNLLNLKVERIEAKDVAEVEYSEKPIDSDERAVITKRIWSSDFPIDRVVAEDNFDAKREAFVTATVGNSEKSIRWDENRAEWDCTYKTKTSNFVDQGCQDESNSDLTYVGFELPLYDYFDSLSDSVEYETDQDEIEYLIDRYRN